jgi:hypothetical protein
VAVSYSSSGIVLAVIIGVYAISIMGTSSITGAIIGTKAVIEG